MTIPPLRRVGDRRTARPSRYSRLRLLVAAQLAALVLLAACARVNSPQGWAGGEVVDDTLYIGTVAGDFRAIDTATGDIRWRFDLRGEETDRAVYGRPAIDGNNLYFGGFDGLAYALTLDGEDVWDTRVGDGQPIIGGPVLADDLLLLGSSDGYLYGLETADGSVRWKFEAKDKVWSTPTVSNGRVYFGSLDHTVYALDLDDGSEVWRFDKAGAFSARPIVANGHVYIGSFDSNFYALDAETGAVSWTFGGADRWYWADAIVTEDTVYAPSLDGNLYALDITNGDLKWKAFVDGPIVGTPALLGDRIAIPSARGRLVLVRLTDGVEAGQCDIGEDLRGALTVKEDMVFMAAKDRSIRALLVKANGNPDEEWVHRTNEENPVPNDWIPAC